jgi:plasmid maintenance system antidote protein VapI
VKGDHGFGKNCVWLLFLIKNKLSRQEILFHFQCLLDSTNALFPTRHIESDLAMASENLVTQESYNPNHLLDILIERLNLKNDAALSRALEVAPPVISKIRHRRLPVGASMLIRMHEVSTMSVRELRDLMGDRRTKYRLSDAQGKPKPATTEKQQING